MTNPFATRIKRLSQTLRKESGNSALIISSAPTTLISRDSEASYRQSSDFFYLTGSKIEGAQLFFESSLKTAQLVFEPKTEKEILWSGAGISAKDLAQQLGIEAVSTSSSQNYLKEKLQGVDALYFQTEDGLLCSRLTQSIMALRSHERGRYPKIFKHSDLLIAPMRVFKDRSEVENIKNSARISYEGLKAILPLIKPGTAESKIAAELENFFRSNQAELAFSTISASGASAAVLHYHELNKQLRAGELFMLDYGARAQEYCADITRVFPVNKKFSSQQRDLYNLVLSAQKAAISKIKDGVLIKTVQEAASKVLAQGLIDLKILKGPLSSVLNKKKYSAYYPHGIGHQLGIDVHDLDLTSFRADPTAKLLKGMVFTIEPGLYFSKAIGRIPACGIRIEDDILVEKSGCEILTRAIPKEISEIENLLK